MDKKAMGKTKQPSNRAIGALFVTVCAGAASWQWHLTAWGLWPKVWIALSIALLVITVVAPKLLTPINRAWMRLGEFLHHIVSPVVLGAMYAILIVPVGLFMRLIDRDALRLQLSTRDSTYWIDRDEAAFSPESFKNQF